MIDYLKEFPIPQSVLPLMLRALLEPIGKDPKLKVEVTARWTKDQYGPGHEHLQMIMAAVPEDQIGAIGVAKEAGAGVISYSVPVVRDRGALSSYSPTISGHDYIVASWGDGSFYSFALAEKVWMAMGLSARSLGGELQKLIYDDLSLPEFGVAEGEISTQYHFSPKRDVRWTMSNEYLRRYLRMRGAYGVRVFFYEALLADSQPLRSLMGGQAQVRLEPKGSWYQLVIREHKGGLLVQVWASVAPVEPELCPEQTADGLIWPNTPEPMSHAKADAIVGFGDTVYLDDRFLERYEQSSFFETTPAKVDERWHCSPSYLGQWAFTWCVRVGRNMISVPMRELYKAKPDREIIHARTFAIEPAQVAVLDQNEEHIVAKTDRFLVQFLDLGDNLSLLGRSLGIQSAAIDLIKFSRVELRANGWLRYPDLSRLAQVAPISMTEQAFLSRCKGIHEVLQRIPNGFLRELVLAAGHDRKHVKDLGSLKLIQALLNIVQRLNKDGEKVDAFGSNAEVSDLKERNAGLAALFVNNDLRIADAHNAGDVLEKLETLGFDIAALNEGYGRALDHVFDGVIDALSVLNSELAKLLQK